MTLPSSDSSSATSRAAAPASSSASSVSSPGRRVSRTGLVGRIGLFPLRQDQRAQAQRVRLVPALGLMLVTLTMLTTPVVTVSAAPERATVNAVQTPPASPPPASPPAATAPEPAAPEPAAPAEPPPVQDPAEPVKRDKDAPVTVRGCLAGVMLGHVESDEEIARLTPTLRLLSKKEIKKRIKSMDGYMVEATGLLKLPPKSPLSRTIGNTTVSVGLGDPRAPQNQPMYRQQIDYGTLDVTAITSLSTRCGLKR